MPTHIVEVSGPFERAGLPDGLLLFIDGRTGINGFSFGALA